MRLLIAGGALLTSLIGAVDPPQPVFTIGVLRRDAIVVPFATYNGQRWENYWPEPMDSVDVPVSLHSVPERWWGPAGPLENWQAWTDPGPRPLHVRQPDWLVTHCQKQVGLRTDYQPRQPPPATDVQPYPKDGLAISPAHPVQPIDIVPPDAVERQQVAEILPAAFSGEEEKALAEAQGEGSPVRASKKEMEALPITIEAMYAFGTMPRTTWIEATREIDKNGVCAAVVFGAGWFVRDAGQFTHIRFDVSVVPCSREGLHYMLPLGVISVPRGQYWIAQWSGWDDEAYDVIEMGARAVEPVLVAWGGGC